LEQTKGERLGRNGHLKVSVDEVFLTTSVKTNRKSLLPMTVYSVTKASGQLIGPAQ